MFKYVIAFVLAPLMLVFNLTQLASPKPWITDLAGDHWVLVTVAAYYFVVGLIFWAVYLAGKGSR